jgi:hypothetical protein
MSSATKTKTTVLSVRLESADGAHWTAIAGGRTLEETLEFALASAPMGRRWRVVGWADLYGD